MLGIVISQNLCRRVLISARNVQCPAGIPVYECQGILCLKQAQYLKQISGRC